MAEQREETSKKTQDAVKNKIIPTKEEVKPEPAQETVEVAHEEVKESQSEEAPKADAGTIDLIDEYVKKFSVMGIKSDRIISYYGIDHIHSMEDGHIQDMIGRYDAIINDTMKPNAAYPLVKK